MTGRGRPGGGGGGSRPVAAAGWKGHARPHPGGWFDLATEDTGEVPVRLFLTPALLEEVEDAVYPQIVNATRFPGARLVAITPDVHVGYGVPVGSVILTDARRGAVAMGPVGFDIGCGMVSARSDVPAERATPERRLAFNRAVLGRVAMGAGEASLTRLRRLERRDFEAICRGGAVHYMERYGSRFDRQRAERDRIPVDDAWEVPWGGPGRPERGISQLGSLGGGNHFIELQRGVEAGTLFVQVHTGSRGFGHGLATNYLALAREERPELITDLDLGYFTPDQALYSAYLNAVAAGANFAIVNRMVIAEEVAAAFEETFAEPLELVYEISHNLVQREVHPEFGEVLVHRKGATRAFPPTSRPGRRDVGGDRPPGAHPGVEQRPLLHPPATAGRRRQRLLGQPRGRPPALPVGGDAPPRSAGRGRRLPEPGDPGQRRWPGPAGRGRGCVQVLPGGGRGGGRRRPGGGRAAAPPPGVAEGGGSAAPPGRREADGGEPAAARVRSR